MSESKIVITPNPAQCDQLVEDLKKVLDAGAFRSNTDAICEGMKRLAAEYDPPDNEMAGRRANAPGPATGGKS